MTKAEEALLGSLPSLGAIVGSAIAGLLINSFGRRNGGVILSLPVVVSENNLLYYMIFNTYKIGYKKHIIIFCNIS